MSLKGAKSEALAILDSNWEVVEEQFVAHLKRKLGYSGDIKVDKEGARKRLKEAAFVGADERDVDETGELMYLGYTDGEGIWIDKSCEYEQMIGTLCHEALHDCVFLVRPTRNETFRRLSCEFEHGVFESLPIKNI